MEFVGLSNSRSLRTSPQTGVAISRIEAPFLMDEFREMAGKNACMTMGCLEFDGDSHTRKADWFGMTVLFDAQSFLHKFQFVELIC